MSIVHKGVVETREKIVCDPAPGSDTIPRQEVTRVAVTFDGDTFELILGCMCWLNGRCMAHVLGPCQQLTGTLVEQMKMEKRIREFHERGIDLTTCSGADW